MIFNYLLKTKILILQLISLKLDVLQVPFFPWFHLMNNLVDEIWCFINDFWNYRIFYVIIVRFGAFRCFLKCFGCLEES